MLSRTCSLVLVVFLCGLCVQEQNNKLPDKTIKKMNNNHGEMVFVQKKSGIRIKLTTGVVLLIGVCAYYFFVLKKHELPKIPFPVGLRTMSKPLGGGVKEVSSDVSPIQGSLPEEKSSISSEPGVPIQGFGGNGHFDPFLYESLVDQINQAKEKGIKLEAVVCDDVELCENMRPDDVQLNDLLIQKIEYAKSKGIKTSENPSELIIM